MGDYSEDYLLNKRVKIFQPDDGYRASTDAVLLAAAVNNVKKGDTLLDVGAGTGAVALCLAERLKHLEIKITGLELQPRLAVLANMSAAANGFDFLHFQNCDIFNARLPFNSFAHVVTNPPYAEKDIPSPNASKAAAHNLGQEGLAGWIKFCLKMVKPSGYFYMINRAEALDNIVTALHGKAGEIKVIPFYSKPGQNAKRVVVCARKDSRAPLAVTPGLHIHQADSSHTAEAEAIFRDGASLEQLFKNQSIKA